MVMHKMHRHEAAAAAAVPCPCAFGYSSHRVCMVPWYVPVYDSCGAQRENTPPPPPPAKLPTQRMKVSIPSPIPHVSREQRAKRIRKTKTQTAGGLGGETLPSEVGKHHVSNFVQFKISHEQRQTLRYQSSPLSIIQYVQDTK